MNKTKLIEKLNDAGIYQLRKGETAQDALDYLNGKLISRKGFQYKTDIGREMDKNEIIAASNKEAFSKSVTKPEYNEETIDNIEDIPSCNDFRDDLTNIGEIDNCQYCGNCVRVDKAGSFEIINCNDCSSYAIWVNCM